MKRVTFIIIYIVNSALCNSQTIIDIDGNIYNIVKSDSQMWLYENLKTTRYNDGNLIPKVTDSAEWSKLTTPGYCWYQNDSIKYSNSTTLFCSVRDQELINNTRNCPIV